MPTMLAPSREEFLENHAEDIGKYFKQSVDSLRTIALSPKMEKVFKTIESIQSIKNDPQKKKRYEDFCKLCNEYASLLKIAEKKGKEKEADEITEAFRLGEITINEAVDKLSEVAFFYSRLRQGEVTNALATVSPKNSEIRRLFDEKDTAQIEKGKVKINFPSSMQSLFKPKVQSVFDALLCRQTVCGRDTLSFNASWYMELCGLTDRKEALHIIKEAFSLILQTSISFHWNHQVIQSQVLRDIIFTKKDGNFVVRFNDTFLKIYSKDYGHNCMSFPLKIFGLNKNTNAYHYARKITLLKHMNNGNKNEDIVSIYSLVKDSTKQLDWDDVMNGDGRRLSEKIVDPIERDLDDCDEIFTWHYCSNNGKRLKRDNKKSFTRGEYRDMLIKITWKDRPKPLVRVQSRLIPSKAKRRYKAAPKIKKAMPIGRTKGRGGATLSTLTGGKSVPIGG